jgi:hypothetical protein
MPAYGPQRIAAIIGKPEFNNNVKRWLKVSAATEVWELWALQKDLYVTT